MTVKNPLLQENPLAHIAQINPEHVVPAISQLINDNKKAIEKIVDIKNKNWQNFYFPLEEIDNQLSKAWAAVSHLNNVCNSNPLREAYDQALALLTQYSSELGQHQGLFLATNDLYDQREVINLTDTQVHILKDALLGFKLSGLDLSDEKKERFKQIRNQISELSSRFEQNLLDATMSWTKLIANVTELKGLPENELNMLSANAKAQNKEGYLLTLEIPSYLAVMTYADDRKLREEVYYAFSTRASELGFDQGKFDNSKPIEDLLSLKQEEARLLEFSNYVALSLETKMAKSAEQVLNFLYELNDACHQQAKDEFSELSLFAENQGCNEIMPWDVAYYGEKLKEATYEISQSELREYFPANRVIQGMFDLTSRLFAVEFKSVEDTKLWHEDASHYQIIKDGKLMAEFYLDLYARPHKRGGAWMSSYQGRFKIKDGIQHPIAFLTCNFAPPHGDKPALLTHDEVLTLFHEFGHGLHHMLTQVDELTASGISNVPWDVVELPSQFLENFCYHPEVIAQISGHYQTGVSLPADMLEKLIAAKNFQSAMMMVRQIEFALFDITIHMQESLTIKDVQSVLNQIREKVAVVVPPEFNRFQHSFSHIFAGGYSAGYYSYKWAEVLSADAFSLFEEKGVLNPDNGRHFLTTILEKGGSADPMKLFVDFRGREPDIEALLRHSGIKSDKAA
ncbi:MAG: M3 family metallopeptidase [Gammaproteobacteria bacterium]|nr:M3 family metallopeptidase [Gammaproteobacteria bacterium]